ncbi:transposase [Streptomyces sp. NPDC058142]|uniref:transposase n=1 Tax=Streptomyces sp. NPDC058142 TaxID=3346355 RepID=UPI0036EA3D8B
MTLIVGPQSVKAASTVGKDSRGYDAGKKIKGHKRHIVVDTLGLPVMITVTPGTRSGPGTCSGASGSHTYRSPRSGRTPPTPVTCCPTGRRTTRG